MGADSILGLCDSIMDLVGTLRKEYMRCNMPVSKVICGEWINTEQGVSLKIYERLGFYFMEETFEENYKPRYKSITRQIVEPYDGELLLCENERSIVYDREQDRLTVEYIGVFERKAGNDETK